MQVRWANVKAIDVKYSQDLTHQKSLKSVNFWQSYWKIKKGGPFFVDTVYMPNFIRNVQVLYKIGLLQKTILSPFSGQSV